jgi:hypothetical protein
LDPVMTKRASDEDRVRKDTAGTSEVDRVIRR